MKPGTEIHIVGHDSVLDGLNAVVIDDGEEVYFVTLGSGIRASLPRRFIREGLT